MARGVTRFPVWKLHFWTKKRFENDVVQRRVINSKENQTLNVKIFLRDVKIYFEILKRSTIQM